MRYAFPADLQKLINAYLASGRYANEDAVIREALIALTEEDEDNIAVRDAIAEWRSGDQGTPLADAFAHIRDRVVDEPGT
jgi:putative addiction module CopG family antidote